jgi:DNA repair protein RadC
MIKGDKSPGHRKRLRDKFLRSGLAGFQDYEVIELLLTLGSPRKDCKQPAKEVIKKFKTLRQTLSASLEELQEIDGIGPRNAFGIKLVQEVAEEFLKQKIIEKPVYKTGKEIFDYLYHSMRDLKKELFKVIYLNSQNQIIDIADLFEGTVNASSIYPREIMKAAIKHDAVSLIFVHNHPSGDPEPSKYDKEVTRDLVFTGSIMQIRVLDHIIIGNNRYFSFAGEGLIEEYETDFLGLRLTGTSEAKRNRYRARLVSSGLDWAKPNSQS